MRRQAFDRCKAQVKAQGLAGPGQGARQQGRVHGPLRRRPGGGGLSGSGLVHLCGRARHRRDRRVAPEERQGRRTAADAARDAEALDEFADPALPARRPAGASRCCATSRCRAAAARHGRHRASASAVWRHHGQQGGADAGPRLRAGGLDARCASTSAASAPAQGQHDEGPRRARRHAGADRRARRAEGRWRWPAFPSAPSLRAARVQALWASREHREDRPGRHGRAALRRARRCRRKRTTARW